MLIFMGAGFQGALRTHRFRTGVLLAVASALIVCLPWFALISFVNHAPLDAIEIMLSLSAIMGSIGSLFGQGFGGLVSRWHEPSAV